MVLIPDAGAKLSVVEEAVWTLNVVVVVTVTSALMGAPMAAAVIVVVVVECIALVVKSVGVKRCELLLSQASAAVNGILELSGRDAEIRACENRCTSTQLPIPLQVIFRAQRFGWRYVRKEYRFRFFCNSNSGGVVVIFNLNVRRNRC